MRRSSSESESVGERDRLKFRLFLLLTLMLLLLVFVLLEDLTDGEGGYLRLKNESQVFKGFFLFFVVDLLVFGTSQL